ncbi:ABC transporter ATP-binding protein [Chondrinema litorale]|uniref:ABC transporter ATP-binding protein n=1 Tax=Chondrinema litorale TaxID=2994555 RepID=UPI0025439BE9|nr:ABC transporter ATP-binding protein [Chondrinema litorale]UZR95819.1 ABC transporter ATP-binding protein [Chondrinema litorale]
MKIYIRLLSYAYPLAFSLTSYIIFASLAIIFGLLNFSLLIPLLEVLFGTVDGDNVKEVVSNPSFEPTISYVKDKFNYHFISIVDEYGKIAALEFVCILIMITNLLKGFFRYFATRVMAFMRARLILNLRKSIFEKVSDMHSGFFAENKKGDLASRMTSDIQEVENSIVNTISVVFREPATIIGYFFLLFMMSTELTLFTILVLPTAGVAFSKLIRKLKKQASEVQIILGDMLSTIDEALGAFKVIKGFNAENYINNKFEQQNKAYAHTLRSMSLKREIASPLSEFVGVGMVAGILFYGGTLVLKEQSSLEPAEFITYIVLLSQILIPMRLISSAISSIQRGLEAGKRVLHIIDQKPMITDKAQAVKIDKFNSEIEFKDVSFTYDGEKEVLKGINFKLEKGKTIALVGPSGGGKSTIADLIPRFYDPIKGIISMDGISLTEANIKSVRDHMGIVTQESILFNDTIANNISFAKTEATREEVIQAAKIANAHDFIMQAENGYDTFIGDRGLKLSGGQRQRISIARAVLKNPDILILDEATSALDTESEKLVQDALTNLLKNRTSIIIAHRLSTIQHADKILVIKDGEIIEKGNHESLMTINEGVYRKLNELQSTI